LTEDCIFCAIATGRIPSDKVYEDDLVVAFRDINPKAPVHVLAIPKRHVASLQTARSEDWPAVTASLAAVQKLAHDLGVADDGYRVVTNIGERSGQTVHHLHWHLLGGRALGWPPG
jgi:histidine triad (HIT) family protein